MKLPFNALGKTIEVIADVTAPTGVSAPVDTRFQGQDFGYVRVVNASANIIYMGTGSTAAIATSNAVTPTSGTPTNGFPVLAGETEIIRVSKGSFFSGIASAPSSLFITPGLGE